MRALFWVGSSREDLRGFPEQARLSFGYGLFLAQQGEKHPDAKPLKGFGGTQVMEIVERVESGAYRVVYAAQLTRGVYVLHAFQKKSKRGIATSQRDIDLIRLRLRKAMEFDAAQRDADESPT